MADGPVNIDYACSATANVLSHTDKMPKQPPPDQHSYDLPQQRLLLELLSMSGEIAVMGAKDETLLWNTLTECEEHGWVTLRKLLSTATTIRLAKAGRDLLGS